MSAPKLPRGWHAFVTRTGTTFCVRLSSIVAFGCAPSGETVLSLTSYEEENEVVVSATVEEVAAVLREHEGEGRS